MNQPAEIQAKITIDGANEAADALNRVAAAAERIEAALKSLQGANHGGIKIEIVGEIARVEILPPGDQGVVDAFVKDIQQGGAASKALDEAYGNVRRGL